MGKYSKLKQELEILELKQKHEIEVIRIKHEGEKNELLSKCNHKYEDSSSAFSYAGAQWSRYSQCAICGESQ